MGIKGWAIRVVLGIVLGFGAAFVVEVLHLGLIVAISGSLDDFLKNQPKREEFRLLELGLCTMIGGTIATFVASFLGVLIAPAHYTDRLVLRSWGMAAVLAALAGGGVGGLLSLLNTAYWPHDWVAVVVLPCGVITGVVAAIFLRLRVNR